MQTRWSHQCCRDMRVHLARAASLFLFLLIQCVGCSLPPDDACHNCVRQQVLSALASPGQYGEFARIVILSSHNDVLSTTIQSLVHDVSEMPLDFYGVIARDTLLNGELRRSIASAESAWTEMRFWDLSCCDYSTFAGAAKSGCSLLVYPVAMSDDMRVAVVGFTLLDPGPIFVQSGWMMLDLGGESFEILGGGTVIVS